MKTCAACGDSIDLLELTRRGQFRRADSQLCSSCKKQTRWAMTADEIAQRDGTVCGICATQVDMALAFPDVMRKSVDHVIPRANGGLDVPSNLQLAHLRCNASKSNRTHMSV
ncbi:HNH endonuclease [Curtobacterium sp. VKM Ac-1376]|nr:HNH endonuclease [Curtobacterium sp. VKM Ac-1376]